MKKISKKQLEVLKLLSVATSKIIFISGIYPHCFIPKIIGYKLSIATMFAMEKSGLIFETKSEWNSSEYSITDFGRAILLEHLNQTCYCGKPVDTSNPDCVEYNLCKEHSDDV